MKKKHVRKKYVSMSEKRCHVMETPGINSIDIMGCCTPEHSVSTHHHSTNSYEPVRFLQTSQNRLINIHRKSLKHISQSALFGFSKNIGHDQI